MRKEILALVLFSGCAMPTANLKDLQEAFRKPEYIASNDGWAEARRRRLLKKYLQANGIPFSEATVPLRGKYNRVVLHAGNVDAIASRVTLSLSPGAGVAAAQSSCDKVLFSELKKKIAAIDFVMTDSCIGLTAHEDTKD